MPITDKYISRRHHAAGIHERCAEDVHQLSLRTRKFRELGWTIHSTKKDPPTAPNEEDRRAAASISLSWLNTESTERLASFLSKAKCYEWNSEGHRVRLRLGNPASELRVSPSEYEPTARKLIGRGWTLVERQIEVHILDQTEVDDSAWGFDARIYAKKQTTYNGRTGTYKAHYFLASKITRKERRRCPLPPPTR